MWNDAYQKKLIEPKDLEAAIAQIRSKGKSIATLNGSFDLMHAGHLHMIYEASKQADVLIVALNSDSSIKQYKSIHRPIIPLEYRLQMMAALGFVGYVTWFDETDPRRLLSQIKPDVHVNGAEYGENCMEAETVKQHGGKNSYCESYPWSIDNPDPKENKQFAMRLIYTSHDQQQAFKLSEFLKREGIDNNCEIQADRDWGSSNYGDVLCRLWVIDEDQIELAQRWINQFETDSNNPLFESKSSKNPFLSPPAPNGSQQKNSLAKGSLGIITLYTIITCSLMFLFGQMSTPSAEIQINKLPATPLYTSELNKKLLYDYPAAFELIDKLVKTYGIEKLQNLTDLPTEGKVILNQFASTPYWQGLYPQLVTHIAKPELPWNFAAPLFEKIRQGEIWRLVTPIFLHGNILHLFFNMLWLVVLGNLIEDRIGILRYVLLIVLVAAISNTAQYLMSGFNFLGISGVIVGMLGFIWSRQKLAAWEGYRLPPAVFTFMATFIFGIAFIQLIAFFQEAFWHSSSFPSIASSAHIVGGLVGWFLGRFEFFRTRQVPS